MRTMIFSNIFLRSKSALAWSQDELLIQAYEQQNRIFSVQINTLEGNDTQIVGHANYGNHALISIYAYEYTTRSINNMKPNWVLKGSKKVNVPKQHKLIYQGSGWGRNWYYELSLEVR